jgi:hypothetical protein
MQCYYCESKRRFLAINTAPEPEATEGESGATGACCCAGAGAGGGSTNAVTTISLPLINKEMLQSYRRWAGQTLRIVANS